MSQKTMLEAYRRAVARLGREPTWAELAEEEKRLAAEKVFRKQKKHKGA